MRAGVANEAGAFVGALLAVKLQQAAHLTTLRATAALNQGSCECAALASGDWAEAPAEVAAGDMNQPFADLSTQAIALLAMWGAALASMLHRCKISTDL